MTIYNATLSAHKLWLIEPSRGCWYLCITGRKPIREDRAFENLDVAKRTAHALAHLHLEGKRHCDCKGELSWEAAFSIQAQPDNDLPSSLPGADALIENREAV